MSHVVFLLGSYYPNFSAVGYCAYQVQKCLKNDFDISVLAFRNDPSLPLEEIHEEIKIFRIETEDMKQRNALKTSTGRMARARTLMLRARGAARKLLAPESIDWTLVEAYEDRLNSMEPRPSAIVPLVFPFETVLAALRFKEVNPGTKIIPYLFDDFVESGSLHILKIAGQLKRRRHLHLERKMLQKAYAVLSMHPLREHFEENFDEGLLEKITFIEHPLLTQPDDCVHRPNDGTVRLCFTGSLIRKVREPDYLLDLLRKVRVNTPIHADFFVMGNAADKVPTESIGDSIYIVNHGKIPKQKADAAVRSADILINIGEAKGKQVSSKIFEYMSTGKPIIHLAYVNGDVVTRILEKYPLSLCLVIDSQGFDSNTRRLDTFISGNKRKSLPYSDVKMIYPEALPETTASHFRKLFS